MNAVISPTATPDGSVGGTSKLELDTAGLQAAVTGTISTNTSRDTEPGAPPVVQAVTDSGSWTRAQLGVSAQADGPLGSKIAVTGQDQVSQSVSPYAAGAAPQVLETQALSGTIIATLPLLPDLDAQVGSAASQSSTRNATVDGADASHLQTGDTQISTGLSWRVLPQVTVDGGVTVERQDADLDGDVADSASFSYVKPKAGVTVTPWQGSTVKLGAEQAVDPLNGANYMALASLSDRPQDLKIAPDHAWQYQASIDQKFGAASISASVTQGQNGSATELAPVSGGQTPASVAMKKKQNATVAFSLPLEGFGLSDTQLQSQATWRHSLVRDPVTGEYRRANGEVPREASVNLTKNLPGASNTKIGLSGQLATTQEFYQVSQTTQMKTAPRLGAFLSYAPGPIAMDVRVDGLMGGAQQFTDTFYEGSRNGPVSGTNSHKAGDAHISFSFSKKM
ncbi:MAG TPA: hypothetical protein VGM36_07320 [Rhizomicrobium sp.]